MALNEALPVPRPRRTRPSAIGHNGGPPLENEHEPEWGRKGSGNYFSWKAAHAAAWSNIPRETMLRRLDKAEHLGLTYEEYTLEILERGRYLQPDDVERIAEIKRARRRRRER